MALSDYVSTDTLRYYVNAEYAKDGNIDKLITSNLTGVFGIPYQFMDTVDRRLDGTELGRKYAEKIVSRLPLLFITPGKQVFMDDYSKDDAKSVASYLTGLVSGISSGDVSELITGKGKYYSFEFDYSTYYTYVNTMAWAVAAYMGIGDEKVKIGGRSATKLKRFDWSKATSDAFKTYFSAKENVVFYLDGMTQVSESYGNNTTESSLASTINGFSDTAKEIQFILGDSKSVASTFLDVGGTLTDSLTGAFSGLSGILGGGLVKSLMNNGVTSVLSGGKIIFPEIWQDSSFDRDYSLDIKLRSPDHDSLSIYLNILVPYIHLLALCLPRGVEDDPNAYTSPFLVKAYCKGMFNVEMGMITSMSVSKGAECCWNDDGLPTQIDISLTIKDLYSSLFMTGYKDSTVKNIVNNTSMMDFLANMAGLNLGQMEMGRRIRMYITLKSSVFLTTPSRIWTRFDQKISNLMNKIYNRI
jgi:hypothetical protein